MDTASLSLEPFTPAPQTGESWNRCVRPKALGAWNLHEQTKALPELEHFVLFSSISSWIGHQGAPPFPTPKLRAVLIPVFYLSRALCGF